MAKGYVTQMTYITQEVLAQGRFDAGAKISGQMMQEGNMDFVKVWNEARKAQGGEEATDEDPKSVKDQLKEAVGSVSSNTKSETTCRLPPRSRFFRCMQYLCVMMLYCKLLEQYCCCMSSIPCLLSRMLFSLIAVLML